jgi:hypothetical protein
MRLTKVVLLLTNFTPVRAFDLNLFLFLRVLHGYIGEDFQIWKFDQGRLRGIKTVFRILNLFDKAFNQKFHKSML